MLPEIWGPSAWKIMHAISFDYPINPTVLDKMNYYNFYNNLQYVLPCGKCRNNLADHYKNFPITQEVLSSRENLIYYVIDLHNIVNYYTNKPILTYDEALSELNKMFTEEKRNKYNWLWILLLVLLIIIIMLYMIKKLTNK